MKKKKLCIDFDDTICNRENSPIAGAKEILSKFKEDGYRILIGSSRMDTKLWGDQVHFRVKEIRDWLEKHDIPYDDIVSYKPPADLYIDDKGYHFGGNWNTTYEDVKKIVPL